MGFVAHVTDAIFHVKKSPTAKAWLRPETVTRWVAFDAWLKVVVVDPKSVVEFKRSETVTVSPLPAVPPLLKMFAVQPLTVQAFWMVTFTLFSVALAVVVPMPT